VLQETVPEFLEKNPKPLPRLMTVERTKSSSYQFYLIVRHYRKEVEVNTKFFTYNKTDVGMVRGSIEEHSLFAGKDMYVLEGFNSKFIHSLSLPQDVFVLAECDHGELKAVPYNYKGKRPILKVLFKQLGLDTERHPDGKAKLTKRGLIKQDWTSLRSYELYEPFLRRARILGWTDKDVERELFKAGQGNLLTLIKRGQFKELFEMAEKYGHSWTYNMIVELLGELIHYRALKVMGYDERKCAQELGAEVGYRRAAELEDAHQMLTQEDIKELVDRVLGMEHLVARNPELGLALFALNSPIRVR